LCRPLGGEISSTPNSAPRCSMLPPAPPPPWVVTVPEITVVPT